MAVTNVLRAVAFGLSLALVLLVAECLRYAWKRHRGQERPYDWQQDGECDNRSHPRIIHQADRDRRATSNHEASA